jgi:hypothetical protein
LGASQLFGPSRNFSSSGGLQRTLNSATSEDCANGFSRNHFSSFPSIWVPPRKRKATLRGGSPQFFRGNQFSSFLWLRRSSGKPGDQPRRGRRILFSTEPLFLIPPRRDRRPRKIRLAQGLNFFSREPLFLIPPGRNGRSGPVDRRRRAHRAFFRGEPLFLIPLFRGTPLTALRRSPSKHLLALRGKEIEKFWQYGKRTRRCSDSFRQHPDVILTKVAEEMAPRREMPDT